MRYACTECCKIHSTERKAARCHWGIGGVIPVKPGETFDQAEARQS